MTDRNISNYKAALKKHQGFLSKFKVFPQQSRKAIWVQLLQLPLNHQHFRQLTKPYPLLPEHTIDKQVSFIVSALTRLYPDLGNQWLPGLVYPFVKLFKEDAIAAFEVSLTFIVNWFMPIFQDYPNSSKQIMNFCSKQLRNLQKKINSFDYPLSAIIQPILLVALTDILNKDQTIEAYDYLVSHPFTPELYLCLAVTIVAKMEQKLCRMESIEDIAVCLRKQKQINMTEVIKEAVALRKRQQEQLQQIYDKKIFPLSQGRYPICEFIRKVEKAQNSKLSKDQEQEINKLNNKYAKLQKLVQQTLKDNQVTFIQDINKKYEDVEGQLRQYLKQVQREHQDKWNHIRELEENCKNQINHHQKDREKHYEQQLKAIERRGRVDKQIQGLQQEAENIRQAQRQMLDRLEELSIWKRQALKRQNAMLREQQRLF